MCSNVFDVVFEENLDDLGFDFIAFFDIFDENEISPFDEDRPTEFRRHGDEKGRSRRCDHFVKIISSRRNDLDDVMFVIGQFIALQRFVDDVFLLGHCRHLKRNRRYVHTHRHKGEREREKVDWFCWMKRKRGSMNEEKKTVQVEEHSSIRR